MVLENKEKKGTTFIFFFRPSRASAGFLGTTLTPTHLVALSAEVSSRKYSEYKKRRRRLGSNVKADARRKRAI